MLLVLLSTVLLHLDSIRKKCLFADPGYATAIALAAGLPEFIVFLPDDREELEAFLMKTLYSYVGNEKFIENPTQGNILECLWGHISRICGFLNSCPAANMGLFNLNASAAELGIADVMKMIPMKAAQSLHPDDVAGALKELFCTKDENGNFVPPTFEEPPLGGPLVVSGCSKIESEIFGNDLPTRKISGSGKSTVNASPNKVTFAEAEQHLDPLQLQKYRTTLEFGKSSFITKYERIVQEKITPLAEPTSSSSRTTRNRSKFSPTASQTVEDE
mgnify:CR=1 FL=1